MEREEGAIRQLTHLLQGSGRVDHGNRHVREDGGDDQGLLQGALSLTERKHDALEEGGRLVEGLLQSMVVVIIQLPSQWQEGRGTYLLLAMSS